MHRKRVNVRKRSKMLALANGSLIEMHTPRHWALTLEEVSVIDIIDEAEMLEKWDDFIYSHHYRYTNNFFDSYLGMFPRRSCETVFAMYSLNVPADGRRGFKPSMKWSDLYDFVYDLVLDEQNTPEGKNLPLYYTADSFKNRDK